MRDKLPKELYTILACPVCKEGVIYAKGKSALNCKSCNVTYPVSNGIPILLPSETKELKVK